MKKSLILIFGMFLLASLAFANPINSAPSNGSHAWSATIINNSTTSQCWFGYRKSKNPSTIINQTTVFGGTEKTIMIDNGYYHWEIGVYLGTSAYVYWFHTIQQDQSGSLGNNWSYNTQGMKAAGWHGMSIATYNVEFTYS